MDTFSKKVERWWYVFRHAIFFWGSDKDGDITLRVFGFINLTKYKEHTIISFGRKTILRAALPHQGKYRLALFIDDLRDPPERTRVEFVVARSSEEAIQYLKNGLIPDYISFDHDLGGEDTAMRVCHYLIERHMDHDGYFPDYVVHSANPIGSENIRGLMESYIRTIESRKP